MNIGIRSDGYINAIQLCNAGKKEFDDYQKIKQNQEYINVLSQKTGISNNELIMDIEKGGIIQGTYVHRKLAYHLSQWISPCFAVQISNILDSLNNEKIMTQPQPIKKINNHTLVLNGVNIISRDSDGFINATELCKAGNKKFNHWYELQTTKKIITELEDEILNTGIPVFKSVISEKGKNGGSWIHPDLAVQLAQWISPQFAIKVSRWTRELMMTGKVELGNEKSNKELEYLYQEKINNLQNELDNKNNKLKNYETTIFNRNIDYCPIEYYGKDIVYFLKFNIPPSLYSEYISKYPNLDNKEYSCIEFGVSSDFEKRLMNHKRDKKKDNIIFLHALELKKRYTASKMELYLKTIAQ